MKTLASDPECKKTHAFDDNIAFIIGWEWKLIASVTA